MATASQLGSFTHKHMHTNTQRHTETHTDTHKHTHTPAVPGNKRGRGCCRALHSRHPFAVTDFIRGGGLERARQGQKMSVRSKQSNTNNHTSPGHTNAHKHTDIQTHTGKKRGQSRAGRRRICLLQATQLPPRLCCSDEDDGGGWRSIGIGDEAFAVG